MAMNYVCSSMKSVHTARLPVPRQVVLGVLILLLTVLPGAISAVLSTTVACVLTLISRKSNKKGFLRIVWPLIIIFVVGLVNSFNNLLHDVMRDVFYASNPIALIFIGYCLAGSLKNHEKLLVAIINCGVIAALFHLSKFLTNPVMLSASVNEIRSAIGTGNATVTLAFILFLFRKDLHISDLYRHAAVTVAVGTVLLASLVLSFSRTEFLTATILAFSMMGYVTKFKLKIVFIFLAIFIITFITLDLGLQEDGDTFYGKLARSFTEVRISDYNTDEEINNNWRGFETYQALLSVLNASFFNQIVGQGFGALVDLGIYMALGGSELRYIPTLHNGYAYVAIKFGLLGIFLYFIFFCRLIVVGLRNSASINKKISTYSRLLFGCTASLVGITVVTGGVPEVAAPSLILLTGYAMKIIINVKT